MSARIKDVAERAGVSSATVSRVLANKPHISQQARARVLEAVEALGYRPNRIARSLRVQRSTVIGLMITDIQTPLFNTVFRAVEDTVHEHGFGVFLCNSDEDAERENLYLNLFIDEQVAGVILAPAQARAEAYSTLLAADIPLALVDREVEALDVDTVVSDNFEASHSIVKRLIEKGHKRIGAIFSNLAISTGQARFEGYKYALNEAGLGFDRSRVRFGQPTLEDGYSLSKDLLDKDASIEALFMGSKMLTSGTLHYLYEQGFSIPGDIALGAFDTLDWFPHQPEIVVAEQPAYAIGETAAKLLLARIEGKGRAPERIVLPSVVKTVGRSEGPSYAAASS